MLFITYKPLLDDEYLYSRSLLNVVTWMDVVGVNEYGFYKLDILKL
jgi:hypothetical protein